MVAVMEVSIYFWAAFAVGGLVTAIMFWREMSPWAKVCGYGWNRSNGSRFSIFRWSPGTEGDCAICAKNVRDGKPPIKDGWPHKTKWL